jgi:hypothetical protein
MGGLSLFFLGLFSLILFSSYIIVRRKWLPLETIGPICAGGTAASLIAFGLAEGLIFLHALLAGLVVGLMFSGAAMLMAAFFQANEPSREEVAAIIKGQQPPPKS